MKLFAAALLAMTIMTSVSANAAGVIGKVSTVGVLSDGMGAMVGKTELTICTDLPTHLQTAMFTLLLQAKSQGSVVEVFHKEWQNGLMSGQCMTSVILRK